MSIQYTVYSSIGWYKCKIYYWCNITKTIANHIIVYDCMTKTSYRIPARLSLHTVRYIQTYIFRFTYYIIISTTSQAFSSQFPQAFLCAVERFHWAAVGVVFPQDSNAPTGQHSNNKTQNIQSRAQNPDSKGRSTANLAEHWRLKWNQTPKENCKKWKKDPASLPTSRPWTGNSAC